MEVRAEEGGRRLDAWLAGALGVSRGRAVRLLGEGRVKVLGRVVGDGWKGRSVEAGWAVEVGLTEDHAGLDRPIAADGGEAVLAEGNGWVVLDKPAGMPVHPLRADETGTLVNTLAARWPGAVGVGEGGLRSGVVHRLDVPTSGCVVLATEQGAWERLRAAFSEHRVAKRYRAVVRGRMDGPVGEWERVALSLAVTRHRPARVGVVAAVDAAGRRCRLAYRVVEVMADATVVEVDLETGFLHQVRATFAHLGHPVWGDADYGGADGRVGRLMLHAERLVLDETEVVSPLPADFTAGLRAFTG